MDDTDTIKIQFRKRDEDDWMDCEEPMFNRSTQYRERPIDVEIWYRNYFFLSSNGDPSIGVMFSVNPCEITQIGEPKCWVDDWVKYIVEGREERDIDLEPPEKASPQDKGGGAAHNYGV